MRTSIKPHEHNYFKLRVGSNHEPDISGMLALETQR